MRYEYYEEKGESWYARLKSRAVMSIPNIDVSYLKEGNGSDGALRREKRGRMVYCFVVCDEMRVSGVV